MKEIIAYLAWTLVFVFLLRLIRAYQPELAIPSSLSAVVFICGFALSIILPVIDYMSYIAEQYTNSYFPILIKAVGISLLTATASEICRSAGEDAIASKVELLGKCELLVLSLPILKDVADLMFAIVEGLP